MQQTEMVQTNTEEQAALAVLDLLKTVFHLKISRYHIKMVQVNNLFLVDEDKLEDTDRLLHTLIKEIKRRVPEVTGAEWLEANPSPDKLFAAATIVEMISKIGVQENEFVYEEFLDMVVSLLDVIFYGQKQRKRIHFSKYKALFELIRNEFKADVNGQPGQLEYKDKTIWFRSVSLVPKTDISITSNK